MNVLVDSDVFCKLALANLFEPALQVLGYALKDCGRLPALTHMLKRGRLWETYGADACAKLATLAGALPAMTAPGDRWLDSLVSTTDIDPGEALLFAKAAEDGTLAMTGDKRALRAVSEIPGVPEALRGRIVVVEAILISLCVDLGVDTVREAIKPIRHLDTMLRVCFSDFNSSPVEALSSYYRDLGQRYCR